MDKCEWQLVPRAYLSMYKATKISKHTCSSVPGMSVTWLTDWQAMQVFVDDDVKLVTPIIDTEYCKELPKDPAKL